MVALGAAGALTLALLDVAWVGRLGLFFDLCFVTLCLLLALRVQPGDFFLVGVLPPLIMAGALGVLAVGQREAIAQTHDGFVQAVVSGLATHSAALMAGYAVCLGVLYRRMRELHEELDEEF